MKTKLLGLLLLLVGQTKAQNKEIEAGNIFHVLHPDYALSPKTGMTRENWKDAARYLLSGAFSYIHHLDDPMYFPKQPGKSYPRTDDQIPTAKLEGLCRTLFMAAPLLAEDSNLVLNNVRVLDYYRHQFALLVDPKSPNFIAHRAKNGGPSQNLVEFGALAISLFNAPEILWRPLPQVTKDALERLLVSYGDGPTVPNNWKFFNIYVLSFFKQEGYKVNEKLLQEYIEKALAHYRGDGWYNDNPAYDYYSMWAFQTYGIIWTEKFGKKYYPEFAAKFVEHFKDAEDNYPYLFGRDGRMIFWGRSMTYRMGSVSLFPFTPLLGDNANYGWFRRISSATILQFLQNPNFLEDEIPTLGFYGAFEPGIQPYSCRGSVYWLGKAFLGMFLPKDNAFWTAKENDGPWSDSYKKNEVYNRFSEKSQILITNYPNSGASEIRAWCNAKRIGASEPFRSSENYNRLSYNSIFPWQADSSDGTVAMSYVFLNDKKEWEPWRLYTFKKFVAGVYYRDAVLETNDKVRMHLAEIPLANGILRLDEQISTRDVSMRLGHYALPDKGRGIKMTTQKMGNYTASVIDNGEYQLALIPLEGWQKVELRKSVGLHPETAKSAVLNLTANFHPTGNAQLFATLMLWKKSSEKWTAKDWQPISKLSYDAAAHKVVVVDKNSKTYHVDY